MKKKTRPPADRKEYLEVLADDINGKFDVLMDAHKMLNDKLDSHTEKLDSHTEMIGSIKIDVEIIKEDVAFLKNGIKRKVDTEEFSALERRVILLEKRLQRSRT